MKKNRFVVFVIKVIFISLICQLNIFISDKIKNKKIDKVDNTLTIIYQDEVEVESKTKASELGNLKFEVLTDEEIKNLQQK